MILVLNGVAVFKYFYNNLFYRLNIPSPFDMYNIDWRNV